MEAEEIAKAEELGHGGLTRYLGELGYAVREVTRVPGPEDEATAELIAGATVQVNGSPQKIKLTMTLSPDEWSHFVERDWADDEHIYVWAKSKPGGVLHPETVAEEIARKEQMPSWEEVEERQQIYGELSAERGPGEEPPTSEEVDAALEAYRRRLAAEGAEREREEGRFVVNLNDGREVTVYGAILCAECGNPTSVGTIIRDGEVNILRPVHTDCFEELQESWDLSHEIMVELRGFIVAEYEVEGGDE